MNIKKLFIAAVVLGVLGGGYGLYIFNLPSSDVSNKTVDISISADKLITAFKDNESEANTTYLNKVILVSGKVMSISKGDETQSILLKTNDLMSAVSCEMSVAELTLNTGDMVQIKGQCAGYLMDVVLTKCVLQK